jgi:hypothetical protein
MREHTLVAKSLGADQRVNDLDGDVRIFKIPTVKIFPTKVHNPNAIRSRDRLDRPLPYADPPGIRCKAEVGKITSDEGVLLVNVEIRH